MKSLLSILTEIGEGNSTYSFELSDVKWLHEKMPAFVRYTFSDENNNSYFVDFKFLKYKEEYDISFNYIPVQITKLTVSNAPKVVGTVSACFRDFIKRYPKAARNHTFSFVGVNKTTDVQGSTSQRTKLFRQSVKKTIPDKYVATDVDNNYTRIKYQR